MKSTKINSQPDSETKWFRIVARKSSAQELEELRDGTLFINPGESIHKVVVLEFDDGNTAKVLSKIRDKDSRINILVKNKRPTGEERVSKADTWVTEKDYDKLIAVIKKDNDVHEVLNANSEQIHKNAVWASDLMKTKRPTG